MKYLSLVLCALVSISSISCGGGSVSCSCDSAQFMTLDEEATWLVEGKDLNTDSLTLTQQDNDTVTIKTDMDFDQLKIFNLDRSGCCDSYAFDAEVNFAEAALVSNLTLKGLVDHYLEPNNSKVNTNSGVDAVSNQNLIDCVQEQAFERCMEVYETADGIYTRSE